MTVIVPASYPLRIPGDTEVLPGGLIRSSDLQDAIEGAAWSYARAARRCLLNYHTGAANTGLSSSASSHSASTILFTVPWRLNPDRGDMGVRVHYRLSAAELRVRFYSPAGATLATVTYGDPVTGEGVTDSSSLTQDTGYLEVSLIAYSPPTAGTLHALRIEEIPINASNLPE